MPSWNNYVARGQPVVQSEDRFEWTGPTLEEWRDDAEPLTPPPMPVEERVADERILVVEDDRAIRRLYVSLLERRGYQVEEAVDGVEGLVKALAGQFDLVLADLNMPRLDGWGLLARLRDDHRTRELPVAFISCEDGLRETLRTEGVGAQAYISKGTRLELIAQQVHLLLEPVRRIRRALMAFPQEPVKAGGVGPQFLVRAVADARWTGALKCIAHWAQFELWFDEGQPVHASAVSGQHQASGVNAFNAFIAVNAVEGTLTPEQVTAPHHLGGASVDALIEGAVRVLNDNAAKAREQALVSACSAQVNEGLYAVYARYAPQDAMETAKLACEERLTPAQVLARSERSPIAVEREYEELVRRELIRF